MVPPKPVSILLLGSGWTSKFLIPELRSNNISFARTRRNISQESDNDGGEEVLPFSLDDSISAQAFQHLPPAQMVVTIFPLKSNLVQQLVSSYEQATSCSPAWLALGSTGAWQKPGVSNSDSPINPDNERAQAEEILLSLHSNKKEEGRKTAVLNLAGLYGDERNPANFAKRAADTKEKLKGKTSLHLVHGNDVARAILEMYKTLQDEERAKQMWGRRWIVTGMYRMTRDQTNYNTLTYYQSLYNLTDAQVYDWWQLLQTLKPTPIPNGQQWVDELMQENNVKSLPRPWPKDDKPDVPREMERALDSHSFWQSLKIQPSLGRCDDYGPGGGGATLIAWGKGAL